MFPSPGKPPEFDHRLVRALEHPVRVSFLKLLAEYGTLCPAEALEHLQESDLLLSQLTYHVRVLDQFGLVEAAGQPDPERGLPFQVTPSGEFALAALGYSA